MNYLHHLLCKDVLTRPARILALILFTIGTLFALASSKIPDAQTPINAEEYALLMSNRIARLDDLVSWHLLQQDTFARLIPPGLDVLQQPGMPELLVLDSDSLDWEPDFLNALAKIAPTDRYSVPTYDLSLQETAQGTIEIRDSADTLVYVVPAPNDYQPPYEALFLQTQFPLSHFPELARYHLRANVVLLPMESVEHYLFAKAKVAEAVALAREESEPPPPMMMMGEGGEDELRITGMSMVSNALLLEVGYPESYSGSVWSVYSYDALYCADATCEVAIAETFMGLDRVWTLANSNLVLTGATATVWLDTQPPGVNADGHPAHRFYAMGANTDADADGLSDGFELFVTKTQSDESDTDGDGWNDGEELAAGTDPLDRFDATTLARGVVLNEVLYNPSGSDTGKEWIELYSAGRYPVNLSGFVIQIGDMDYTNAYVFPANTWLDPGHYLLLGGTQVSNRDLEVDFAMPNRFTGDATAAVRLAAEVGTNTWVADCLMYGSSFTNFNANGLDTTGWISSNAISAGAGNSLYRFLVGHDTDQSLDWGYRSASQPHSSIDVPDTDGDGLTDEEELTGIYNPFGEPTDPLNADSDGDGLSDYDECMVHGTNPNTWASDGDIFPWPPSSGLAVDWWGSDAYEVANGWNPLVSDENTNGIPDSWEMAFPGTNLYADADGDGVSNFDELEQNSNPFDETSSDPQAYVIRFEATKPGWSNDGMSDIGIKGEVKVYFAGLQTDTDVTVWIREGRTQEEFIVEWVGATPKGETWNGAQEVFTSATLPPNSSPYLLIKDAGLHSNFTTTPGGEYRIEVIKMELLSEKADNSPKSFGVGKTDPLPPCNQLVEDVEALAVYYNEVFDYDTKQVDDFDVTLKVTPTDLQVVTWSKVSGPSSGNLTDANQAVATYRNPKVGGLYQFDATVDNSATRSQLWLPVAGPDISYYWQNEINYFKNTWGPAYRTKLDNVTSNLPAILRPIQKHSIALQDMAVVGINLDWMGQVYGSETPCGGPQGADGQEWRHTIHGIVIDFRKRNNMMYALIGREMTLFETELKYGPNVMNAGTPDQAPAYAAYEAGFDLFDGQSLQTIMQGYGYEMQIPDGWAQKEWPSSETSQEGLTRKAAQQLEAMIQ